MSRKASFGALFIYKEKNVSQGIWKTIFSTLFFWIKITGSGYQLKDNLAMPQSILIHFPAKIALALNLSEEECQQELKKLSIIKLYELGKISSGIGAKYNRRKKRCIFYKNKRTHFLRTVNEL
jgi:hypothetical protein